MTRALTTLVVAATALAVGRLTLAQEPAQPPAPPAQPPASQADPSQELQVSDADLETFADIYVELQEIANKYQADLSTAETEEESREVQTRIQEESIEKVSEQGWTPDQFNTVAQAINSDPALAEKALALIAERS